MQVRTRGERVAGAPLRFSFPGGQAPPFAGEMLASEPMRPVELRWGSDILRLELRPAAASATELTLLVTLEERGAPARAGAALAPSLDVG